MTDILICGYIAECRNGTKLGSAATERGITREPLTPSGQVKNSTVHRPHNQQTACTEDTNRFTK